MSGAERMRWSRFLAVVLVVAVIGVLVMSPAGLAEVSVNPSEEPEDGTEPEDDIEEGAGLKEDFAQAIIEAFPELGLTVEQLQAWRDGGRGYGELAIACSLASKAQVTPDEILALADSGLGWGEIADQLGIEERAFGQVVRYIVGNAGPKEEKDHGPPDGDDGGEGEAQGSQGHGEGHGKAHGHAK